MCALQSQVFVTAEVVAPELITLPKIEASDHQRQNVASHGINREETIGLLVLNFEYSVDITKFIWCLKGL